MSSDLFIRNPHSILQAIKKRPKEVLEISLPKEKQDDVWKQIEVLAEQNKIRIGQGSSMGTPSFKSGSSRNQKNAPKEAPKMMGRESGHGALIKSKAPVTIEQLLKYVEPSSRGVWLALDSLQDPQNLGAIFRAAAFFGVKGLIMTVERSAPMSSTVYDIASGGVETVPFYQAINLKQALDLAKEAGLWILGTSEHAKESIHKIEKDRAWLLVMGNEEKGIRRLTEESCDVMCTIPAKSSSVTSLNVSVATGILLAHLT